MDFLGKKHRQEEAAAKESADRLSAYYKWLNELRDQEAQARANYTQAVQEYLGKKYDAKLEELDQMLAAVNADCAAYTAQIQSLERLQVRVCEELAELAQVG